MVALLDASVESTFGDQPELRPGSMSDEYKLELDTALPALRARVKHLGLALADIHDILGVLISWGGVTPLERCC